MAHTLTDNFTHTHSHNAIDTGMAVFQIGTMKIGTMKGLDFRYMFERYVAVYFYMMFSN